MAVQWARLPRWLAVGLGLVWLTVLPTQAEEHAHGPAPSRPVEQSTELAVPCPVMPDKQANGKYKYVYEGRTYYFCCSDCVEDFKDNPKQYIDAAAGGPASTPVKGGVWRTFAEVLSWQEVMLIGVALSLLVTLGAIILWRVRQRPPAVLLHLVWLPLLLALAWLIWQERYRRRGAEESLLLVQAKDYFNYAVSHDYGSPPVPVRPPIPPRLRGMYYRGNDERTDRLWNNGHYRTCSFDLRLEQADGTAVESGARPAPGGLQVRLDIIRAPFTTEEFWSPALMRTIFLTQESNPVDQPGSGQDRVSLVTLEPRQKFTVGYPVGVIKGTGSEHLQGMIYVCETMTQRGIKGARYHLGIRYDITLQDGVVLPQSDLWMGALYRTRRVTPKYLPLHEWFSHLPIPELPHGNETTDATALGLADYQHIIEQGDRKAPAQPAPPKDR